MRTTLTRFAIALVVALVVALGGLATAQVMTVLQTGEPRSLSPNFAADTGGYGPSSNIYSHLVTMDWGVAAGTAAYGDLAESWETSDDGLTYTFHLHQGVTWHDGAPLTSADVKFTFDRMIEKNYPYAAYLRGVTGITTPDDRTVVITLERPNGAFVPMMAQGSVWTGKIYPQHLWASEPGFDTGPYVNEPIGSGPFMFKAWNRGNNLELVANPNYFRGRATLDGLTFRFVGDANVARAEFDAGNIVYLPYDYAPPYAEIPLLSRDRTIEVVHTPSHYSRDIQFNLTREPLNNHQEREAIALAVDRQSISNLAFAGQWAPAFHANVDSQTEWINRNVSFPGFDAAAAERLLDEAGYPRGAGGWRFPLSVTNPVFADCRAIIEILVQQLRAVGIEATWDQYDQGTWFSKVQQGDFDITCYFTRYGPDPDAYAEHFQTGGPRNFMRYSNPEFDALVAEARAELDPAVRKGMYDRIQEILVADLPYLNLFNESKMSLIRAGWTGFNVQPSGYDRSYSWFGFYAVQPPR